MIIDLNKEMEDHLARVKRLAVEADNADSEEHGYQSRASAMTACSTMLVQLTKAQESLVTMEALMSTERAIIDTVKDYLEENQLEHLLNRIEAALKEIKTQ